MSSVQEIAKQAKSASRLLAKTTVQERNQLLDCIGQKIERNKQKILQANQRDIERAEKLVEQGEINLAFLHRLKMGKEKVRQLKVYLEQVRALDDPLHHVQMKKTLAEGLELTRITTPIGVIAVIFESRPEVVIQVSALGIKSGNAVILKGGSEAAESNRILFHLIREAEEECSLPHSVHLVETREDVSLLLQEEESIDLIIPRGSNTFIRYIQKHSQIPVIGHSSGICHIYVDEECDVNMAIATVIDAKTDYPSACNAVETLLVHRTIAPQLFPELQRACAKENITIKACERAFSLFSEAFSSLEKATEGDWKEEYLDLILAVRLVDSLDEAIDHINRYGSHHTDSILTNNDDHADRFCNEVDSACVFHNASTRFSDGFVFGLGAEVGVSTNKTHARGPVGLEGLLTYKYVLVGKSETAQIKSDFSNGKKQFIFQTIA